MGEDELVPNGGEVEIDEVEKSEYCGNKTGVKTLRLAINLFTNVLLAVTVFVCLVYAGRPGLTWIKVDIITSVVGYQVFVSQAVMALSQSNGWTVHLKRRHRYHVHWVLLLIGVAIGIAGTVLYILYEKELFNNLNGAFRTVAAGAGALTLLDGLITFAVCKLSSNVVTKTVFIMIHTATGVATLILSAIRLCFIFASKDFANWLSLWFNNDDIPVPVLQFMTGLFTLLITVNVFIPDPHNNINTNGNDVILDTVSEDDPE